VRVPTLASFQADSIGSASSSADAAGVPNVHTVTQPVTSLSGVTVDNIDVFAGSDVESNIALAARARLKLASLSTNGPKGAYEYAALSSQRLAPTLLTPLSVSQVITREADFVDLTTGWIYAWIANANGAPSVDDITATNEVIQAYAVPVGQTAFTDAATNVPVAAVVEAWVPAAANTTATEAIFQNALIAFVRSVRIGGATDEAGGAYSHVLLFDAALGSLFVAAAAANIAVEQITLTLDGDVLDIPLAFSAVLAEVAVLSPAVPSVFLHSV